MRKVDDQLAHYRIETLLGQGGMGEVYLAFDTKLHRKVALKLLLVSDAATDEARQDAVARIIREARAAAALEHPNKVSIFELGELDGTPYLAMEYIAGSTLRAFVGDPEIDWRRKLGWLVDVARALGAAHDAGLVHRDIKPENVMVRKDGIVKVLDFGIARRADKGEGAVNDTLSTEPAIQALTGKGVVIGTAAYMPPEQMHGQDLDGRADQFAWGVMAYELLAGKHPWSTDSGALAMVGAMLTKPAPSLEGFPEVVVDTVARALSHQRDDRFASMNEIVTTLANIVSPSEPMPVASKERAGSGKENPSSGKEKASSGEEKAPSSRTDVAMARTEISEKTPATVVSAGGVTKPEAGAKSPRRWAWRIGIGAVVAAALAIGGWRLTSTRSNVEYCVDFRVTSTGLRCVGPVTTATMGLRYRTFKLTSGPHGLDFIERLNVVGLRLSEYGQAVRADVRRAEDGSVKEIVAIEQDGPEQWHEVWSENGGRIDYVEADGKTPRFLPNSRTTTIRREYDDHGFVRRERTFGPTGKPRASEAGIYGKTIEHAPDGFALRETYLGADGEPMADRHGVAAVVRVPEAHGLEAEFSYLDLEGHPLSVDGVASMHRTFNAGLEEFELTYFAADGAKVSNLQYGTHGLRFARDPIARTVRTTLLDEAGKPRQMKGFAFTTQLVSRDVRGRRIGEAYFDGSGNAVIQQQTGGAAFTFVFDEHDHVVEFRVLDPSGRPMPGRDGFALMKTLWDDRGNRVELRTFDVEGKPAPSSQGPPILKRTFDERGLTLTSEHFDAEGHPAFHAEGVASSRYRYDALRNETEVAYFGLDGKSTLNNEGVGVRRQQFDEDGGLVEQATFDASGALTFGGDYAKQRIVRDAQGLEIELAYFDTNDNLLLTKEGFAIVRYVRDRSGDIVEESTFGPRKEPIARLGGYATKKNTYDIHRRRIETTLFDLQGTTVVGAEGWAIEKITYDERGLVVRESHLDVAGNPVVTKAGSAAVTKKYDGRGNLVEVATLGTDARPIVTSDGYAMKRSSYDPSDLLVEEALLGSDGRPVLGGKGWAVRKLRYDELGNVVEESFFDADRKPVVAKDPPYASKRDKLDDRLRIVRTTWFDASGAPAKGPEGVEWIEYVRDAYGHAVKRSYHDGTGTGVLGPEGSYGVLSKFDDAGRLIEETFVEQLDAPVAGRDGCVRHRIRYDELGRERARDCVDAKGAFTLSTEGWAAKRFLRDAKGLVVEEATYGSDQKLRADKDGIARKKSRYDDRRLLLETTFWGADDKPAKDAKGAVARRYRYDEIGKQIAETAIHADGKAVPTEAPAKK